MKNGMGRVIKESRLVYGEGSDDGSWLKYIKSLLYRRNCGFTVKVKNGEGGSPVEVVCSMIKLTEFNQYDVRYALFDDDRKEVAEAIELAQEHDIIPLISHGCLEAELLTIIGKSAVISRLKTSINTGAIKKKFKKECGGHNEYDYARHFPRQLLDQVRGNNEWLDKIMQLFE